MAPHTPAAETSAARSGAGRVLVVEDEARIAEVLEYALQAERFEVVWRATGADALAAIGQTRFDLLILDVGLPDMSGFELCKAIRREHDVPIIFLTARSDEIDRVVGLEIGGDDYVSKPFSPREVCARVKVVLRRARPARDDAGRTATVGHFELDEGAGRIRYLGRLLELTRYEFLLLRTLLAAPERIFSRGQLLDLVWTDADVFDRTVDTHIKTLRAKLRRAAQQGSDVDFSDPIVTHRGLGYSLRSG